ncbi:MAG: membrane or secreted protein [Pirellulales bacterium]|nr:membrane or secreted protein [Pirellulales bacterium]
MAHSLLRRSALAACLALAGCAGEATPRLAAPGTVQFQRDRAEFFDPYPQNEYGPTVLGGRPKDFDRPAPEATRSRWFSTWLRGG